MIPLKEYIFEAKTEIQEKATCNLFNHCIKYGLKDDEIEEYINSEKSLKDRNGLDTDDWKDSFIGQVKTMIKYFKDWKNPIAAYYSKKDGVAEAIINLENRLIKEIDPKRTKHAIDPVDIIVYSKDFEENIKTEINNLTDNKELTGNALLTLAINKVKDLYNGEKPNQYIGISLKKGNGNFTAALRNFNKEEDDILFSNQEITNIHQTDRGISISFDATDSIINGKPNIISGRANIRTSKKGSDRIRFLPTINKHSQVGDCPVFVYKNAFDNPIVDINLLENSINPNWSKKSKNAIDDFLKKLKEKDNLFPKIRSGNKIDEQAYKVLYHILSKGPNEFQNMLLWCEKVNDKCMPYLLISQN